LHLSHGPIDVVLKAWGAVDGCARHNAAGAPTLSRQSCQSCADELAMLRMPNVEHHASMVPWHCGWSRPAAPSPTCFVTPMAAVAGAVADELLAHMTPAARWSAPSSTTAATSPCW
jgi:ApbE superfamily uncharacterized protein (UPF0280 family)